MDLEKYYDRRGDGTYIVHFPNGKGLNMAELQNIFGAFGTVLSINNRGQTCGLCFVKYKYLEDVKRCVDGLQNHQFIKILPHINKKKPYNKQLTHSSPKVKSKDDSFRDTVKYLKEEFKRNQKGSLSDGDNLSDISFVNSKRNFADSDQDSLKCSTIVEPHEKTSSTSISSKATTDKQRNIKYVANDSEIPHLLTVYEKYYMENRNLIQSSVQIIPSQEIIVANIHPSLSIHFILHLFEKYNPISVSMMRKTAKAGIRYCHVYYRTNEEAYATVREFDGYSLQGKGLIVLTSQELLKEAF